LTSAPCRTLNIAGSAICKHQRHNDDGHHRDDGPESDPADVGGHAHSSKAALSNPCTARTRFSVSIYRDSAPVRMRRRSPAHRRAGGPTTFFSEICRGCAKGTHAAAGCRYDGQNICTQILFRLSGVRSPGAAHPRWQLPSARSVRSAAVQTPGLSAAPNRSRSCISAARIAVVRRSARPSDARVLRFAVVCDPRGRL
jgi:hypothetical protein